MIKLLLDQGLPRSCAAILKEAGMDIVHTSEVNLAAASDSEIMRVAEREGRVVVTLDADFHALLAVSGARSPSVVRIRVEGLDGHVLAFLLMQTLQQCSQELQEGAAVTVQRDRIRLRRLPLV